jgi:hypothetical protein
MDSTFLGTLLYLKRAVERQPHGQFTLLSPSTLCCGLLAQMGLTELFTLDTTAAEAGAASWTLLQTEPASAKAFKQSVVQAHQELANLPGPAGEPFRALTGCLKSELEAEQAKKG